MTKGVSRQPEGVTPAYSQAGSEKRRKRRTRDTSSFYGAQARFRTDNVDPIENACASCLKAIDCFSSNMSETAALCRLPSTRLAPFSFSRRVDEKFAGELYKCGFSSRHVRNVYENTRQTSVNGGAEKAWRTKSTSACGLGRKEEGALLITRSIARRYKWRERRGELRCRDYMQKYDPWRGEKLVADGLSRGLYHTGNK